MPRWPKGASVARYDDQLVYVHEPCPCGDKRCHGIAISPLTPGKVTTTTIYIKEVLDGLTPLAKALLRAVR